MRKIIVIGGGAAGMMAAYAAAMKGSKVALIEKNEKLGKKLYITGKGRCNITNMSEQEVIFDSICSNSKFFYSSFNNLNNFETYDLFEKFGLRLKTERGNRAFPISDHSSDVINILKKQLQLLNVEIHLNSNVVDISVSDNMIRGVKILENSTTKNIIGDSVIIATGGLSYHSTGSTGDGYKFSKEVGHTVTALYPSLVALHIKENVRELQGISLKNVTLSINRGKKILYSGFGEMLFTDNGISGPLVLSASTIVTGKTGSNDIIASIDLKPALDLTQLDARLLREFNGNENKLLKSVMHKLLPGALIGTVLKQACVSGEKKINSINSKERDSIIQSLKNLTFVVTETGGFNEAVITKGGVSTREINPKTLESKIVKGLYFAGEVIDLDALTGGYNLQIAWSTGYTAGIMASMEE